jgi:replicative DNA helicase
VRAEHALIGALLVDPDAFDAVGQTVEYEDFTDPRAAAVYMAMFRLRADGVPIDYVLVCEALEWMGEKVPTAYMVEVAAQAPTSLHAPDYARRVATAGAERREGIARGPFKGAVQV